LFSNIADILNEKYKSFKQIITKKVKSFDNLVTLLFYGNLLWRKLQRIFEYGPWFVFTSVLLVPR
jgi:hypothetical protein